MKMSAAVALIACFTSFAAAQGTPAPATQEQPASVQPMGVPELPAVEPLHPDVTPAKPAVVPAQPAAVPEIPSKPERKVTLDNLRKANINAVAELKKKHIDEMRALKDSLKGKSRDEIKKAVEARKKEQKAALKDLEKMNKEAIEKFKKENPMPGKKDKKGKKGEGEKS